MALGIVKCSYLDKGTCGMVSDHVQFAFDGSVPNLYPGPHSDPTGPSWDDGRQSQAALPLAHST